MLETLVERVKSMRPEVERDGKGLTEPEFVMAMVIELDMLQWDQARVARGRRL